jgi:hypothetical protein
MLHLIQATVHLIYDKEIAWLTTKSLLYLSQG